MNKPTLKRWVFLTMKNKNHLPVLLLLSVSISGIISFLDRVEYPLINTYFSQGFYPVHFRLNKLFFDNSTFSFGDLFYLLVAIALGILCFRTNRFNWRKHLRIFFSFTALVYLTFLLSWGLNYYRGKQIDAPTYSTKELLKFSAHLANQLNKLHAQLQAVDSLPIEIQRNKKEIIQNIQAHQNQRTDGIPGFVKPSLYSLPLTYMGFSGYLNPFTLEAQVNDRIPLLSLPVTVAHEMAHQQGIASEAEANFIGFSTVISHPDADMRYAAYLFAFRYCFEQLYRNSPEKANGLRQKMRQGIFANIQQQALFWKAYQNPFEPIFKKTYDSYLKANAQTHGIQSYSRVVALLINAYLEENQSAIQE